MSVEARALYQYRNKFNAKCDRNEDVKASILLLAYYTNSIRYRFDQAILPTQPNLVSVTILSFVGRRVGCRMSVRQTSSLIWNHIMPRFEGHCSLVEYISLWIFGFNYRINHSLHMRLNHSLHSSELSMWMISEIVHCIESSRCHQ